MKKKITSLLYMFIKRNKKVCHSRSQSEPLSYGEACEPVLSGIAKLLKCNGNAMLKQVQHDEVSNSNTNAIPNKASSAGSVVASSFCLSGMTIGTVALSVLAICIFAITPALSAFQCVECPENFFCKNGQKTACPASTPVTNGTQKSSESDCMTCADKDSKYPVFDGAICRSCYESSYNTADVTHVWSNGECKTCAEASESTPAYSEDEDKCVTCEMANASLPYWNSATKACVGCDEGETWNASSNSCGCADGYIQEETTPEGAVTIPTTDGKSFYIASGMIFTPTPVSKSTCDSMINDPKYPEVTACNYDSDYWAGAVKACRDAGKRLPTLQELAYLAQVVYGDTSIGEKTDKSSLTIANQELFNTLIAGTYHESSKYVYFWSSEQYSATTSYRRKFLQSSSGYDGNDRSSSTISAFCLGD